jgi:hypothetical protein
MMKSALITTFCLFAAGLYGQSIERSVISSTGAFIEQGSYSLSYTAGQTATETVSSANYILTQGFQQPEDLFTAISEIKNESHTISVYPDPAFDYINIKIKSNNKSNPQIQIFNLTGQAVTDLMTVFTDIDYRINISRLSPGTYMLNVSNDNFTEVLKIVKIAQ